MAEHKEKEGDIIISLSKSEYEIPSLLWTKPEGLTAMEINDFAKNKSWKDTSIHLILNGMLKKECIKVEGMVLTGRTYSRIFKATLSPEEYSLLQVKQNTAFVEDKNIAITNIFAALLNNSEVNADTIDKIEQLIDKKRKEL